MKRPLALVCLFAVSSAALSQTLNYEAVRLTDQLIEGSWKSVEVVVPAILAGMKVQLETGGASKEASKTFTEELQRNFTKDNFARGYSKQVSEKFSVDEIVKLSEFYSSPLGQKLLKFSTSEDVGAQSVQLIIKASCDSVKQKLGFFDRGTINSVCGKF
jgi:hypothetical protein